MLNDIPKISVIIPVYCAEKYLKPCIDSVLCQSYKNFELLLIDDGSSDRSGKICDEYAEKDCRISVFHRENQGVSRARNFGIQQAAGAYILFVDADDLIHPQYIEKLYAALPREEGHSISMCRYQILSDGVLRPQQEPLSDYHIGAGSLYDRYLMPLVTRKIHGSCCRVLFPAGLLKEQEILFSPCKIAEDQLFILDVISRCQHIGICQEPLYTYRQGQESSSHRSYITDYLPDRILFLQTLQQILENASLQKEQYHWLLSFTFQFYRMLLYMNATAAPDCRRKLSEIDKSIFGKKETSKDRRKAFYALLGKKHKLLNFLIEHRMFALIRLIRSHKR